MLKTPSHDARSACMKRYTPYFSWSLFAAVLMFCLGSLQSFAAGLNHVSSEMQIDRTSQASLVYDRDNHIIFTFASEDRTNVSLDRISPSMVSTTTQARRQPGSAFKPLLFAAAIEQGYAPSSLVTDLDKPVNTAQGTWLPSGEHEATSYTLRQALTVSSNRAAARLMQLVGISTTQNYARRLGISSPVPGGIRVPDVEHAGRRHQSRHRKSSAHRGIQTAGGRENGHHRRLRRRLVHRLHAAPGHGRVVRLRRP
jgi:membrane carboxypeptidase/penicillin-binding protein